MWLSEETRTEALDVVRRLTVDRGCTGREPQIVFEGNVPGDVTRNHLLDELVDAETWPRVTGGARAWLGEAIAIKDPTAAVFQRQAGSNMIIVGQRDETALAAMAGTLLSLGLQHPPDGARFYVLDGTPADSPLAGLLERYASVLPHPVNHVAWRDVGDAMRELTAELERRQEANETDEPPVYLLIYGLQRYRMLRRADDFSFSLDDTAEVKPEKLFADFLTEGPQYGMHTVTWIDTYSHAQRALDRAGLGEFTMRILFQMSGTDSTNLIDSPVATRLGLRRALFYHEEHGTLEKFRPYGLPPEEWLERVASVMQRRVRAVPGSPGADAPGAAVDNS